MANKNVKDNNKNIEFGNKVLLKEKILKLIDPDLEDEVIGLIKEARIIREKNKMSNDESSYLIAEPGSETPEYFDWLHRTFKLIADLNRKITDIKVSVMIDAIEGYAELISALAHPCNNGALEKVNNVFYRDVGIEIPIYYLNFNKGE